jgi:folate-binding protein YgfZ
VRTSFRTDLGYPAILEFRGPDAVRFLNGQLTQDVRSVEGDRSLSACVTDAKGKLQFRVHLMELKPGVLWVTMPGGNAEALEARITKYLIADDVEVTDRTGEFQLYHVVGSPVSEKGHTVVRRSARFGVEGSDVWIPVDYPAELPAGVDDISSDELEDLRIGLGIPAWGSELVEGLLPQEANLEVSDISYQKGCYIGQEVISRIKSAGKVNRNLVKLILPEDIRVEPGDVLISDGAEGGVITSVSPVSTGGFRNALGFIKRTADQDDLRVNTRGGIFEIHVRR